MYRYIVTKKLYLLIVLIVITIVTYTNILPNKLFYDDEELIYKNAYIQDLRFIPKYFTTNMVAGASKVSNMYRPILTTSFAIDHFIWGFRPYGYHLSSIILHTLNTVFVFLLITLLFHKKLLAFLTALFFSIHPVNSEAVIYASGRTDPLYTFFALLSILSFLWYEKNTHKRFIRYAISLVLFIIALLSKESAVIVPILFVLLYWIQDRRQKIPRTHLFLFLLPFFLFTGIYILLRLTVLNFQNTLNFYNTSNIYTSSFLIRLFTFSNAFWQYLGIFFFPKDLISARNVPLITSVESIPFMSFLTIFLAFFILSILTYRKNKIFLFSFLWFFLTLLPSSGIIPINNIAAEHYLYLPSIGFFLFFSYCISILFSLASRGAARRFMILVIVIISSLLSVRTILRTFDWRDPITFYTRSLIQSPWHIPMRQNLAMSYAEAGELERAIKEYQSVISLSDTYPNTHHNLANAYKAQKKYKEAEQEYEKALKMDPSFYFSYFGLLDLYKQTGEEGKIRQTEEKIQKFP